MRLHLRKALLWITAGVVVCLFLLHSLYNQASSDHLDDPVRFRHHHAGPRDFHPHHRPKTPSPGWPLYSIYAPDLNASLWPSPSGESFDRVVNQINNVLDSALQPGGKLKTIYLYYGLEHGMKAGQARFIEHQCPVNQCSLTDNSAYAESADLILFKDVVSAPTARRRPSQIWVLYLLESPFHTSKFSDSPLINWTATYRRDSTIVTPYERFTQYSNITKENYPKTPLRNFAEGKTKLVAWFVSNCYAPNGRSKYAAELQRHIAVDIYGACGALRCTRGGSGAQDPCNNMLRRDYKFYLSFENSNCRDYITEKLYWNALSNDVIPIVMGAPRVDYELSAPPHSFIHVDDFASPRDLAAYLQRVASDDQLYNSYFLWKGTGAFIDTKFWCRLCAMLHTARQEGRHSTVRDLEAWWGGPGVCSLPGPGDWATWRNLTVPQRPEGLSYQYSWVNRPVESSHNNNSNNNNNR